MANTFTRRVSRNIGTSLTSVGSYTVGSGVQTTIIGLSVCNTTASPVTASVTKVVLIVGDSLKVQSSAASSLDVVMSILEIS